MQEGTKKINFIDRKLEVPIKPFSLVRIISVKTNTGHKKIGKETTVGVAWSDNFSDTTDKIVTSNHAYYVSELHEYEVIDPKIHFKGFMDTNTKRKRGVKRSLLPSAVRLAILDLSEVYHREIGTKHSTAVSLIRDFYL